MKTAMQEAIELVKKYDNREIPFKVLLLNLELLLNKEKEQMLDFGLYVKKNGWVGCKIEDLYEDYYNQNKL